MVIQHNMSAMNASRQLGLATGSLAKSTEKLSSGYKINRAADDAAGLSISEKMRKQIRGLDQASENIEDGISLCQVADGALNETVDILQRMRELAVQSANGTNSTSDRQFIEMEITQLKSEIDRIAVTTSFNDAVYPLNAPITYSQIVTETIGDSESDWANSIIYETTITFTTTLPCNYEGKNYKIGDKITIEGLTTNGQEVWIYGGVSWGYGAWDSSGCDFNHMEALKIADLKTDKDGYLYYDKSGTAMYAVYFTVPNYNPDPIHFINYASASNQIKQGSGKPRFMTLDDLGGSIPVKKTETTVIWHPSPNETTSVHSGASSSQSNKIPVHIVNATCKGLGIDDLTVVNAEKRPQIDDKTAYAEENTMKALVLLDKAIAKASSYRSKFGATQNRLEHAQKIDDNTSENTQAAESQIRDTDMAAEMVRYANTNILTQAGQSMLAQANQSRQGVLSLVA